MTGEEQREIQDFVSACIRPRNVGEYIDPMIEQVLSMGEDFGPFDHDEVLRALCPSLGDLVDTELRELAESHDIDLEAFAAEYQMDLDFEDSDFRDLLVNEMQHQDIEPEQREVCEWYFVDTYYARKLAELGEVVLNGDLWGRCCSGQSIASDGCIETLYKAHKAPRD